MLEIEIESPSLAEVEVEALGIEVDVSEGETVVVVATPGPPGPPGAPGGGTFVFGEVPSGIKDGSNAMFTLTSAPQTGKSAVYRNGLREVEGPCYSIIGAVVTFTTPPGSLDDITVDYLI